MLSKINQIISMTNFDELHYKKWNVGFRDDYFNKTYWSYFPITQKYFFEGNPAFFYEFKNLDDMGRYPLIMVRDGYAGILDFFLTHPVPSKTFKTILLIPEKFEALVPKQWSNQVALYNCFGTENRNELKKDKLIVHGLGVEDLFWSDDMKVKIKDLKKISEDFNEIIFLLPQRESILSSLKEKEKHYNLKLHKLIYESFGFDANIDGNPQEKLKKMKSNKFHFFNLDQVNGFIFDNYIDHHFYGLGGEKLNYTTEKLRDNYDYRYRLSLFHEVGIKAFKPEKSLFAEFYLKFKLSGSVNSSLYGVYQSSLYKDLFKKYFS